MQENYNGNSLRVPNYELAHLITANCQLNQFMQRNDRLCPSCQGPEDSFHFFSTASCMKINDNIFVNCVEVNGTCDRFVASPKTSNASGHLRNEHAKLADCDWINQSKLRRTNRTVVSSVYLCSLSCKEFFERLL